MLFNLINGITIALGAFIGRWIGNFFPKDLTRLLLRTMGLLVIYIGISPFSKEVDILPVIFSLVLGGILGYFLKLDRAFDKVARWLSSKLFKKVDNERFSLAFVEATVLFAAGSMGIMGAIEAGAFQQGEILMAKSIIDGITAMALASSLGIGVFFSAFPVFLYQAIFVVFGQTIQPLMTLALQNQMSVVGGIIIMGIGINLCFEEDLPISFFIPSIFMPLIFSLLF